MCMTKNFMHYMLDYDSKDDIDKLIIPDIPESDTVFAGDKIL